MVAEDDDVTLIAVFEVFDFFQPQPDFVRIFAGQITQDELAMKGSGTTFEQLGDFGGRISQQRIRCNQSAAEVHQQLIAGDFIRQEFIEVQVD